MKKRLLLICSILLIVTCVLAQFSFLAGFGDITNIQDYKLADSAEAEEGIKLAREGIEQLAENELTYVDGVAQYEQGAKDLELTEEELVAGQAQLVAGQAGVDAGQAELDANYQAYLEGKEQLAKLDSIMPYIESYMNFRDDKLEGRNAFESVQSWSIEKVRGIAANNGIDIPPDVTDLSAYVQQLYAEGQAMIQLYEDGQAQLNQGKATLDAGYSEFEDGKKLYEEGKKQLREGDALLTEYEDGQAELADGMKQLLDGMTESCTRDGEQVIPSLAEMLGDDWSLYKLDEKGNIVKYRDCSFVDLEACEKLCDTAEEYMELSEASVTEELYSRVTVYTVASVACLLGIIAGIFGIIAASKYRTKTGVGIGIPAAALAFMANVIGVFTHYTNYVYGTRDADKVIHYSGSSQFFWLIALMVITIAFCVAAVIAKKHIRRFKMLRHSMNSISLQD